MRRSYHRGCYGVPVLLARLLGCACSSFDEMEVEDRDGAEEGVLNAVRDAITTFAAETGRDGVCVPTVSVRDDVTYGDVEVQGQYRGPHASILVDSTASGTNETVTHELCHAIDELEGLVDANPDLFPGDEVEEELYDTNALRQAEDFARACEGGARRFELTASLDDACGEATLDPGERFVQEHVYTGADRLSIDDAGVALHVEERGFALDEGMQVLDAVGVDGELWLMVWRKFYVQYTTLLVRLDPVTGSSLGTLEIVPPGRDAVGARFAVSDADPIVLVDRGATWAVLRVDPLDVAVDPLDEIPDAGWSAGAAWSEGVLYTAGFRSEGDQIAYAVWAWEDGEEQALIPPDRVLVMRPEVGGVQMFMGTGVAHYARRSDAWSTVPTWNTWSGFARWGPDWHLFLTYYDSSFTPALVDVETGAVGLPDDPCIRLPQRGAFWAEVGDEVLILGKSTAGEDGLLGVTAIAPGP